MTRKSVPSPAPVLRASGWVQGDVFQPTLLDLLADQECAAQYAARRKGNA